jgi:hypothetical protein
MSAIKLVNNIPASVTPATEFRLSQGSNQIARIGVHAGAQASVPTTTNYQAQAFTTMGDFSLTSNTVSFNSTSARLLAQVLTEDGFYDFQLALAPGSLPSAIVCENTWRNPVQFTISQPGSPMQIVTVVDEHNNTQVSTAQQWQCYAIANGITTPTVTVTDPDATITAVANNGGDGATLIIS